MLTITQAVKRSRGFQLMPVAALVLMSFGVAKADRLDTTSYNFALNGGGGGSSALLNLTQAVEIYCNDFNNDIYVPHSNYLANLSTLTPLGITSGTTRFGAMDASGFKTITISDGDANDAAEQSTINGADAVGRYQMAAYLVSQYNLAGGNNASNNNIQMAIWQMLDPLGSPDPLALNSSAQPTDALEMAADWYMGTNEADRESYLQNYRIVSDARMTCPITGCGSDAPMVGGFQEQITHVPEASGYALLGLCLMGLAWFKRRGRAAHLHPAGCGE
jgi:hypothetical protein